MRLQKKIEANIDESNNKLGDSFISYPEKALVSSNSTISSENGMNALRNECLSAWIQRRVLLDLWLFERDKSVGLVLSGFEDWQVEMGFFGASLWNYRASC